MKDSLNNTNKLNHFNAETKRRKNREDNDTLFDKQAH